MIADEAQEETIGRPMGRPIPGVDWGGTGMPLHFLHANGYAPECYRPLIQRLAADFHVFGMFLRPLWQGSNPADIRDWRPFSNDLRQFLHEAGMGPVIGLGHSLGAVTTLRAAIEEPGLFRALILIDPVLFSPGRVVQVRIMRALGIRQGPRLAEVALKRRRRFDDLEQMLAGYRKRRIFRFISDEGLRVLVRGLTRPSADGGYALVYSPEWEARIYQTGVWNDWDLWKGIRKLDMPVLCLRGEQTDTFFVRTAEIAQKRNPRVQVVTIPNATHLVPLERPEEVANAVKDFVKTLERSNVGTL